MLLSSTPLHRGGVLVLSPRHDPSPKANHQVEGALLLDVALLKSALIPEHLPSKVQSVLIWGNALPDSDNLLQRCNGGGGAIHLDGDGLVQEGLHEDLHS